MTRYRGTRCDKTKQHGSLMRPAGYKLLLTDFQALDQCAVARIVLALEVIEQLATAAYQAQQTATGMVILDIVFEMLGQISDACSDQCYLHLGGTRIALGTLKVGNDLRFLRRGNCHWFCSPKTVSYTHLRAHETRHDLVCRLLLEKKK